MPEFEDVRQYGLTLPSVEESTWYRTPALGIGKKRFLRLREDGLSLVLRALLETRVALPQLEPEVFSIPPHYVETDMLVIHLPTVNLKELQDLILEAWRMTASPELQARAGAEAG